MQDTVICPSGLSGRIRGMLVREERILTDRKLARSGDQIDRLLSACWQETYDTGPYDFGDQATDWGKVLQGDRFYALLQIRALTYGPEYSFAIQCQNQTCRERIEWDFTLNHLGVRPLTQESRNAFVNGNRFETFLPDAGKKVWFRLLCGNDERKLPMIRRNAGDRLLSAMLVFRIVEIEGVEPRDKQHFIEELSMSDADLLISEFDRVDCGVDTTIEIECSECLALQEVELPFDQTFFLPGKKSVKKRSRYSPESSFAIGAKDCSSSVGTNTAAPGSTSH